MKKARVLNWGRSLAVLAGLAATFLSATADAATWTSSGWSGFLQNANGPGNSPAAAGTVNFAVFQNTTSDWAAALGIADSSVQSATITDSVAPLLSDTDGAKWVYVYQVVNNDLGGADQQALTQLLVQTNAATSYGYLATAPATAETSHGIVFQDGQGTVNGSNPYLGVLGGQPTSDPAKNGTVTSGYPTPGVPGTAGGPANSYGPATLTVSSSMAPISAIEGANFAGNPGVDFVFARGISLGATSTLLFITSDQAPTLSTSELTTSGQQTINELVTPPLFTPLPATFGLLLSAIPGFAAMGLVFRRKK